MGIEALGALKELEALEVGAIGIEALGALKELEALEVGAIGIEALGALGALGALKELGSLEVGALGIGVDIKGFISSFSLYALKFSFFIGTVHLSQFDGLLAVLFNDSTFSIIKYEVKIIHDNKIASYKCTLITYFNITNTTTNITSVLV
jgi:hypothetical protein